MLRAELIRPVADSLRAHAGRFPDKMAFQDARCGIRYGELYRRTGRLAGHLVAGGLGRGDRVATYLGDRVEAMEGLLAVCRAGAVGTPLDPRIGGADLAHLLDDSGAAVVITDPPRLRRLGPLLDRYPGLRVLVTGGEPGGGAGVPLGGPGSGSYELLATTEPAAPPPDDLGLDEVAWMLYTSGTTGVPKGVLSTQRAFLWSVAACCAPALDLTATDRVLWPLPLFHTMSHSLCLVAVTAVGATARIVDGLAAGDVLAELRREPYTVLAGVPTLYHHLVEAARTDGGGVPAPRACLVSGAAADASLVTAFEETFGVPLLDSYGSTETCGPITTNWLTGTRVPGSCGLPVLGLTVRLVDPGGLDAAPGQEGEVWVSGPNLMVGYHNQPEATAAVLRDGWYRTGDLARRDRSGFLTMTGRLNELIIRGGENIHPADIEAVLRRVSGVAEVAVAGRPDDALGEVPVAYLVADSGGIDPRHALERCRSELPPFKVPVQLYEVAALPRTGSGKVRRRALRELAATPLVAGTEASAPAGPAPAGAVAPARASAGELLDLVRDEVAALCGFPARSAVPVDRAFTELGLTSSQAVRMRDRLATATGLELRATVAFDHPTVDLLAGHLRTVLSGGTGEREAAAGRTAPARVEGADDPVAIVGMGCRFPGGVVDPEGLWRLVAAGTDAVSGFPTDRGWDLAGLYHPDPDHAGTCYAREGGFVHDAGEFDAPFFHIGPREAAATDPQHRLLLETSWEALERSGIDPLSLRDSPTGVFAGVMHQDYGPPPGQVPRDLEGYLGVGTAGSVASGRVSYTLGLGGPAITVDTACSSSLVALHLAVQSLRRGECTLALAGGATVMATPGAFVAYSRLRGLAPDGRCKAFGAAADGVGWGEGAAMLVLEPLALARRNGHPVLALVRGSAVNQDGASAGLTAPSGAAQERVIRQALADAGLGADQVDVVEAHGSGTRLGDPIEAHALLATYGRGRPADRPLWIGSVKSNLGHTQAAAGVAGVVKMVLAMRHGAAPATLRADPPSPEVDWSAGAVRPLTEAREWPASDRPRRAAVSSFGVSGTNAHVILEQPAPPARDLPTPAARRPVPVPWLLCAHSEAALRGQAGRLLSMLDGDGPDAADVGYALATARARLAHRAVVVARGRDGARGAVEALADGRSAPGLVRGVRGTGGLAVWFTGQGSQRAGMGRALHSAYPGYARAFDEACAALDRNLAGHAEYPIREVVFGTVSPDPLDRTTYAQAGLFALEVALFRLVESWGVRPDFVAGHSIGELTAAHVAGVLSLPDAAALVATRGRLLGALPDNGAMVAVGADPGEVAAALAGREREAAVAAVNGPASVVISGGRDAVFEIAAGFAAAGHRTRRLRVSHAFHSPLVDEVLAELRAAAGKLTHHPPRVPILSNVTGDLAGPTLIGGDYWAEHVRRPVRFADGVCRLVGAGVTTFLELGPDGVLTAMAADTLAAHGGAETCVAVPTLRSGQDDAVQLLEALGRIFVRGVDVDWAAVFDGTGARRVPLPTYAFQRRRYWLDTADVAPRGADAEPAGQPLRDVPPDRLGATLLELVRGEAAAVLGHDVTAVGAETSFVDAGISSLTAIELGGRLGTATGLSLPPSVVLDHASPAALADHLTALLGQPVPPTRTRRTGDRWLRRHGHPAGGRVRLVCLPHAGGGASFFRRWPRHLPATVELHAVQYPGREDRIAEPPVDDLHRLADLVAEAVLPLADRPLALFGHSMGAAVAAEVALRCQARGRSPAHLFVSAFPAFGHGGADGDRPADDDTITASIRRLAGPGAAVLDVPGLRAMVLPTLRADYRAVEAYRPRPAARLGCPVVGYAGREDPTVTVAQVAEWAAVADGGFALRVYPGSHFYLLEHEADVVADIVRRLAPADGPATG
ncbi:polyketide synthase [Plantactinospora sp. KLBMP9567]|uniref:polyketide synthase n=1 Tax=Plantactinospora sp. KLBMP9567 TaxID=3085900 RepID=UPI00298277B8|nr:polyketide synthase [Plantactinospora sp. KLBMP9567]MDW5329550.1 AMP-binding protein [Plantactinospora sp. KLBMP9567]